MACKTERLLLWVCLTLSLCGASPLFAQGAEEEPDSAQAQTHSSLEQGAAPSIEFLEFLGQWETDDGEWMAPEELANEEFALLLETTFETGIENSD